jgi:hypothetical protein
VFGVPIMQLTFDVNWVLPRGFRTCYVMFPNLSSNTASHGEYVLHAGHGAVMLTSASGTFEPSTSIPPPNDARGPTWTCAMGAGPENIAESDCGGVAVFDQPSAERDLQLGLLLAGTLIGLALAVGAESLLKFRWPLPGDGRAPSPSRRPGPPASKALAGPGGVAEESLTGAAQHEAGAPGAGEMLDRAGPHERLSAGEE